MRPGRRHTVTFFSKPACPLCDEARDLLQELERNFAVEVDEINIFSDLAVYDNYKNTIPVVIIDGSFTVNAPIRKEELLDYLTRIG